MQELSDKKASISADVVIVGMGVAGLYAALNLPRSLHIVMLSKESAENCDSMLAQGGICVMRDYDDYDSWFNDTMRAGHFENRAQSIDTMIWSSRDVIFDLMRKGVEFDRDGKAQLDYTREGGHSRARIIHHKDITGKEITTKLFNCVKALKNVDMYEWHTMVDLIVCDNACKGVKVVNKNGDAFDIFSRDCVLATGGIGGLWERSTNYSCLTGDGCRICKEHGVALEHMDYVQIHPTSLYSKKPGRAFLISESCRGEGARLLDASGKRFCDELQPRDVVTKAIYDQMQKDGSKHVWLSFEKVPAEEIRSHFVNIYERCLEEGYNIMQEPIPVVPAQHYLMGGIYVDHNSQTTLSHLYAAGETSCNGVHGKNRLASNSLLESLVFARLAARDIVRKRCQQ